MAGCYAIDLSRVDMDLVRYEPLVASALEPATATVDALGRLQDAMTLASCPLLPEEVENPWLDDARRTHQESVWTDLIGAAEKVAGFSSVCAERWARPWRSTRWTRRPGTPSLAVWRPAAITRAACRPTTSAADLSPGLSEEASRAASLEQAIRALNHLVRTVRLRPGPLAVVFST